jgi:hypothetical protein
VTRNKTISSITKKGTVLLIIIFTGTFDTLEATYKHIPTGGVINPMHKLTTMIIPMWTRSTPACKRIGTRIGVKTKTATLVSIMHPVTRRIRFTSNSKTIGLLEIPRTVFATRCGIWADVSTQEKPDAVAITNKIKDASKAD